MDNYFKNELWDDEIYYHVSQDNLTLKPVLKKRWRGAYDSLVSGYVIESDSNIRHWSNLSADDENINVFATEKQAKSALAMAQISQIMANIFCYYLFVITVKA